MSYIATPDGNVLAPSKIGGCKAVPNGFVILGTGTNEVLEYIVCPPAVSLAWRKAFSPMLLGGARSGRPLLQLDWIAIAMAADPEWTTNWVATKS